MVSPLTTAIHPLFSMLEVIEVDRRNSTVLPMILSDFVEDQPLVDRLVITALNYPTSCVDRNFTPSAQRLRNFEHIAPDHSRILQNIRYYIEIENLRESLGAVMNARMRLEERKNGCSF